MRYERTTKEILRSHMEDTKRVPLYNPAALEALRERLDKWMNAVVKEADRKAWEKVPKTVPGSGIPREMLYTPLS